MLHKEPSEGKQYKPRGRPFPKGNKRGKLKDSVLADTGHDISNKGRIITANRAKFNKEPVKDEGGYIDIPETTQGESVLAKLTELEEAISSPTEGKEQGDDKTIETMDFKNGDNTLSIRFSAVNNRRYRIQVFLNNETEIRPVTYQGSNSGYAFWKLLKGEIKK